MLYTKFLLNFQPKTEVFTDLRAAVKSTIFAVMGICILISGTAVASGLPKVSAQTPPDLGVEITDIDGQPLTLVDYKGSPLLVNFWAMWCPPCVAELPALERAAATLGMQSVKILLVSVDRGGAKTALPFLKKYGVSSPDLAFDGKGTLSSHLALKGLPTTILLSADQTRSWTFVGPFEWDVRSVQQDLLALLSR